MSFFLQPGSQADHWIKDSDSTAWPWGRLRRDRLCPLWPFGPPRVVIQPAPVRTTRRPAPALELI
jgi:hypothetical protein